MCRKEFYLKLIISIQLKYVEATDAKKLNFDEISVILSKISLSKTQLQPGS